MGRQKGPVLWKSKVVCTPLPTMMIRFNLYNVIHHDVWIPSTKMVLLEPHHYYFDSGDVQHRSFLQILVHQLLVIHKCIVLELILLNDLRTTWPWLLLNYVHKPIFDDQVYLLLLLEWYPIVYWSLLKIQDVPFPQYLIFFWALVNQPLHQTIVLVLCL